MAPSALRRLETAGLKPSLAQEAFEGPATLLLSTRRSVLAPEATLTADFTSASGLAAALQAGRVPPSVPDVLLDIEHWSFTPASEQEHPLAAVRVAAGLAAAYHKRLVFAPALDLMQVLDPALSVSQRWPAFQRRVLLPAAPYVDALEIQAQGAEGTSRGSEVAAAALAAVRGARPGLPVFIGLSTNPDGRRVTPADLLAVVRATPSAAGYWLNVPSGGPACPRCGQPQPQVGVAFLEQVYGSGELTEPR